MWLTRSNGNSFYCQTNKFSVCVHIHVHVHESASDVFINHPPSYFFRQSLSLNLELLGWTRLVDQQAQSIILFLLSQFGMQAQALSFCLVLGLSSGPQACVANTVMVESFPQPRRTSFNTYKLKVTWMSKQSKRFYQETSTKEQILKAGIFSGWHA